MQDVEKCSQLLQIATKAFAVRDWFRPGKPLRNGLDVENGPSIGSRARTIAFVCRSDGTFCQSTLFFLLLVWSGSRTCTYCWGTGLRVLWRGAVAVVFGVCR